MAMNVGSHLANTHMHTDTHTHTHTHTRTTNPSTQSKTKHKRRNISLIYMLSKTASFINGKYSVKPDASLYR